MRAIRATVRSAFAEAIANRSGFWTQLLAMAANDLVWVAFWLLFFGRVGSMRGWNAHRVLLLFAVLTTSGGIVLGFLSNARRVGRLAADGDLDAVLALPIPPLVYLLVRKVDAVNLGDLVFGVGLFLAAGSPSLERAAVYVCGVVASSLLLTGFLVAVGSLAFFSGRGEAGDFGLHAMLLLASYPADVFTGVTKALLYVVVPAAFVAAVPSRLVDSFDLGGAAVLGLVAVVFATLGWAMFTVGLRRYTSGSVWTRA
jgi:ABC-2 type transport system permease protein